MINITRFALSILSLALAVIWSTPVRAQLTKINVGYSAISGDALPAWIAKDAGIFEKNGLDVQLVFFSGGTTAVMALIAADTPIAQLAGPAVVHSAMAGELPPGVGGSFVQHALETGTLDVVRTGERHQHATWTQQLEGSQVNLLVPAEGLGQGVATVREGGRIEDDQIKLLRASLPLAQAIKDIAGLKSTAGTNTIAPALRCATSNAAAELSRPTTSPAPAAAACTLKAPV